MRQKLVLWTAYGLAALLVLAGALTFVRVKNRRNETADRIRAANDTMARLDDLQAGLRPHELAFRAYRERYPAQYESADGQVRRLLGSLRTDDIRRSDQPLDAEWSIERRELLFNDMPLTNVMAFVTRAERAAPPWKLTKCVIRASTATNGIGRAEIHLQTIARNRPDAGGRGE